MQLTRKEKIRWFRWGTGQIQTQGCGRQIRTIDGRVPGGWAESAIPILKRFATRISENLPAMKWFSMACALEYSLPHPMQGVFVTMSSSKSELRNCYSTSIHQYSIIFPLHLPSSSTRVLVKFLKKEYRFFFCRSNLIYPTNLPILLFGKVQLMSDIVPCGGVLIFSLTL